MKSLIKEHATLIATFASVSFGLVLGGGLAWTALRLLWGLM